VGLTLPCYRELPETELAGYKHAWDVFGPDDELGRLNLITADSVRDALSDARRGLVVNLSLPLTLPKLPWGGNRRQLHHTIWSIDRNSQDDKLDDFHLQASSQWDGFRHIRAGKLGYWSGVDDARAGPDGDRLGIDKWVEHGIVARGILADLPATMSAPLDPLAGATICWEDIAAALSIGEVVPRRGDVLLVRTGWLDAYLGGDDATRDRMSTTQRTTGLSGGAAMAEYLWDSGIAAVATDNPAVEATPGDPAAGSLHRRLLALLGFPLGELFDLRRLAELCAEAGTASFLFVSVPLNVPGGVGSPANAIAIL
jgi:hypothetical protein